MKKTVFAAAASALLLCVACSRQAGWSIEGVVTDAPEGARIAVEGYNNGLWYNIDSLDIAPNGSFEYHSELPAPYPEIMRLGFEGRSIYFPVDSIDRLTVTTTAAGFGTDYSLTGTMQADNIRRIDSLVNNRIAAVGEKGVLADSLLKRELTMIALNDTSVLASFYIINKTVGSKPLFDLTNRKDMRVYGAVANRFASKRPNDPRTQWIIGRYLGAREASGAVSPNVTEITVPEKGVIDIVRSDPKGNEYSLADMASKGKVVLVSFTGYTLESSPAYNVELNKVWERYHPQGLEIYQIAFDQDETMWKQTALNLPWTTVWNSPADGNEVMIHYNVGVLPLTYIVDRTGTIRTRVTDPTTLLAEVAKYM